MKKLAIFVEGQTELHFTHKLLEEIAGYGKINFELKKQHAGIMIEIRSTGAPLETAEFQILIVNCGGDGSVKSSILERKDRLIAKGYSAIFGLLDLYPKQITELTRFENGLSKGLEDENIEIKIYIAVAEIEAWFLNECTHFQKVSPILTAEEIKTHSKFNPATDSAEDLVRHPAGLLDKIYTLAGKNYKKREAETHRLISKIDFGEIYVTVREKSNSLRNFLEGLENFMVTTTP